MVMFGSEWVRKADSKNIYYYDYKGSIDLKQVFGKDFPESYLEVYKFSVRIGNSSFFLIEPPDPDQYDFTDPQDILRYLHIFREKTRVYRFDDVGELKATLEARDIPPPLF